MSATETGNLKNITAVMVPDPVVHPASAVPTWVVVSGPQSIQYERVNSNSLSIGSQTFATVISSGNGIVSAPLIKFPARISFTGQDQGVPLLRMGLDSGIRSMPFTSNCNQNIQLGNGSWNENINNYNDAIYRFMSSDVDVPNSSGNLPFSYAANAQDKYQDPSDFSTYGTFNNALANLGENGNNRGNYGNMTVVSNTNTTAVVEFTSYEPLITPFQAIFAQNRSAIYNVNTMNVRLDFLNNLQNIWLQGSDAPVLDTVTVEFIEPPTLLLHTVIPNLVSQIPRTMVYPYREREGANVSQRHTIAPGGVQIIQSPTISCNNIPSSIMLIPQIPYDLKARDDSDTYGLIEQLNINFNGQNLYSNADPVELFRLSQKYGLNYGFQEWSQTVGSVIKLTSADLNLNALQTDGAQLGSVQNLKISANVRNLTGKTRTFELRVLVEYDGYFTCEVGGTVSKYINPLSYGNVVNLLGEKLAPKSFRQYMKEGKYNGGGVFDWIKKNIIQPVLPIAFDMGSKYLGKKLLGGAVTNKKNLMDLLR
jgi:hypothetical protein